MGDLKKCCKVISGNNLFRFLIVGGICAVVDWSIFYILAIMLNMFYLSSLVLAYSAGAITNYSLNKIFTFKCKSRKIAKQFSLFFILALFSLALSLGLMFISVEILNFEKMLSRIFVTLIIFFFNYFLHKNITFNKKFFS